MRPHTSTVLLPALLVVVLPTLVPAGASAQEIPVLPAPPWAGADDDPRRAALSAGRRAMESGDARQATHHLLNALWYRPYDVEMLTLLLRAGQDDPDSRLLWAESLFSAGADGKGAFQPDRELKTLLPEDPLLARLVQSRAQAVAELATLQKKLMRDRSSRSHGNPILTRFLRSLAWELARSTPALWKAHGRMLNLGCDPRSDAWQPVVAALRKLMTDSLGNQRLEMAIRASRCLSGLASQAAFKDLKGPKAPDLSKVRDQARDGLRRARELLAAQSGPLSIEQLDMMSDEERLEYTRVHQSFDNPGVALSTTGRYRLETVCGHETLLGAARTVELHHDRLVNFFGKDPFLDQQGTVRLVPEAVGLEAEGAPFWWVGGFQSGPETTLRFSSSTISGLGRGLTHELTHRFDGALHPGIPAWLAEGKAVWTGAAYGQMRETGFIDNHANFGTIENTMRKGYGGLSKLTELIEGTIEDYRDNYVAGYALYVYLNTWEVEGNKLFNKALKRFQAGCAKNGGNSRKWFESCFCDGKAGRPKDLKEFAGRFSKFINAFYWLNRAAWVDQLYTGKREAEAAELVFDAPTWQFSRNRAEPWFGEGQAALAGELLLEAGRPADATLALVWAHELDEWHTGRALVLADLLESLNQDRAAWVLRNESLLRTGWTDLLGEGVEVGKSSLLTSLPRLNAHLELLRQAADQREEAGLPLAAAAGRAEHDRIAVRLGLPSASVPMALSEDAVTRPFATPPRYVGHLDWLEDDLTSYEEHRVKGLWYDRGDGHLHVGRKKPRKKTGQMDRAAHLRHAFVRGREWMTGSYRVSARIHFTTTYVDGALILGFTRRDRNVRFQFNAGDYMYSIGQKTEKNELESIHVSLLGIRDGERHRRQIPSRKVQFEHPSTSFEVEILVYGPHAVAFVNGDTVGSYHTADGQPIEGYIGFASSFGAYRVEAPTVESLDRQRFAGLLDERMVGLSFGPKGDLRDKQLINRPVLGVPRSPTGSVLLWIHAPTDEDLEWLVDDEELQQELLRRMFIAVRNARKVADLLWKGGYSQELILAVPEMFDASLRDRLSRELAEPPATRCHIVTHEKTQDLTEQEEGVPLMAEAPTLLFIDPVGVLRAMAEFRSFDMRLPESLDYWLNVYRGRKASSALEIPEEDPEGG